MPRSRWRSMTCLALLVFLTTACAGAAAEPDADAAARRKLQQLLSSRKAAERVEAIEGLRKFPDAETAKLLATRGLKDREPEVRQAAETALGNMRSVPAVCDALAELLIKDARRKGREGFDPAFWILLGSNGPAADEAVKKYLEINSDTSPETLEALEGRCDEIGKQTPLIGLAQLERLAKSPAYAKSFGMQRAVIRAARNYKTKEAVALLIRLLADQNGELRGDIVEFLEPATGERLGVNAQAWQLWWQEHEKTYEYPQKPFNLAQGEKQGGASYYGIPLYAKRIVFIIDASNSMRGEKIAAAKQQLRNAVLGLDSDVRFGLIAFNASVNVWRSELVPASDEYKRTAEYWIENLELAGQTRSYDALEAGMAFDAEAIFFLTDGAPAGGKITEPTEIVTAISKMNKLRRESIYSIGIGLKKKKSGHEAFLDSLSGGNYGKLRRVSE